jgi:ketosteroid isomerase-like protein
METDMNIRYFFLALVYGFFISLSSSACIRHYLPGTTIKDTPDHRAIAEVLAKMQRAFMERDKNAILELVSKSYFEDRGPPHEVEHYGYQELAQKIAEDCFSHADQIHLTIELHEIKVYGNTAYADIRYTTRTHLQLFNKQTWEHHRDFNRIQLQREQGNWRITSGL